MRWYVRLLQRLALSVPVLVGYWITDRLSDVTALIAHRSVHAARINMKLVLGSGAPESVINSTAHKAFRNAMRSYYDLLRFSAMPASAIEDLVSIDRPSLEMVRQLCQAHHGVLLVSPHWGTPNVFLHVQALWGLDTTLLSTHFRPLWLSTIIQELRTSHGLKIVYTDHGVPGVRRAVQAIRDGGTLLLLPDYNVNTSRTGVNLEFFGVPITVPSGMARIALHLHVPIVTFVCYSVGQHRYRLAFDPPLYGAYGTSESDSVESLTRQVFRTFEQQIVRDPEQWILLQPVQAL